MFISYPGSFMLIYLRTWSIYQLPGKFFFFLPEKLVYYLTTRGVFLFTFLKSWLLISYPVSFSVYLPEELAVN
jgi:hypothetical protein